jgi:hypothetical protein
MAERVLYQPHQLDHPEPSVRDEAWIAFVQGKSKLILYVARSLGGDHDDVMDRYAFVHGQLRRDDFHRLLGYAISNQGRLAGKAWWDRSGLTHPTFWEPSGSGWRVKVLLGTMKSDAWVSSVNENHQGVGRRTKGQVRHATLWEVP